jgi:hypothetical protein
MTMKNSHLGINRKYVYDTKIFTEYVKIVRYMLIWSPSVGGVFYVDLMVIVYFT